MVATWINVMRLFRLGKKREEAMKTTCWSECAAPLRGRAVMQKLLSNNVSGARNNGRSGLARMPTWATWTVKCWWRVEIISARPVPRNSIKRKRICRMGRSFSSAASLIAPKPSSLSSASRSEASRSLTRTIIQTVEYAEHTQPRRSAKSERNRGGGWQSN